MLAAAALLLTAMAVDAQADRALLDAFAGPCSQVERYEGMKAAAPDAGWAAAEESADPRLAALLDKGRKAMQADEKIAGATFARTHQGRSIYLVLTRVEMESGIWANGCRVFDFDAPAPIDPATAEAWIGKVPTGFQDLGEGLTKHLWEPWVDGRTFELNYVPADHAVGKAFGLSGVVLVASAIGGF